MKTILVVEDYKNQGLLYEEEFRREGYNVMLARNGREATIKAMKQIPDIIIMEITKHIMDGFEPPGNILANHSRIPIIINTAYGDYEDRFFPWSADALIVKSSDLSKLKNKTKELLFKNCTSKNHINNLVSVKKD